MITMYNIMFKFVSYARELTYRTYRMNFNLLLDTVISIFVDFVHDQ